MDSRLLSNLTTFFSLLSEVLICLSPRLLAQPMWDSLWNIVSIYDDLFYGWEMNVRNWLALLLDSRLMILWVWVKEFASHLANLPAPTLSLLNLIKTKILIWIPNLPTHCYRLQSPAMHEYDPLISVQLCSLIWFQALISHLTIRATQLSIIIRYWLTTGEIFPSVKLARHLMTRTSVSIS